jgi:hypothetical protein
MGLYDEVWFEDQLPGIVSNCRRFQTKSIHSCLDRYIVTKEGRLRLVRSRFLKKDDTGAETQGDSRGIDTRFHGDIRLIASDAGTIEEYIARFTDGTLEWVRPLSEVQELDLPPG